jgi:aminoglycoside 3-N-acetyltransferase
MDEAQNKPPVLEEDILRGIQNLGVRNGDTMLVHSSLSSFGHVEGGAETVIRALIKAVGPAGNIVMPTLSFKSVSDTSPVFSLTDTPSDTGKISDMFRNLPNARRSRHPMSSAAAIGNDADTIVGGRQITPCGKDSPYYYVYARRGYVLFMGAEFKSNTMFHVAEEIEAPSYMRYKKLEDCLIVMPDGRKEIETFYRYDCYQTGIIRHHERLEAVYREQLLIHETKVGACNLMLISAEDAVNAACEVLRHNVKYILE